MSRPAVPPVVLSSTFSFPDAAAMAEAIREKDRPLYTRWSNPTVEAFEADVAALEGAERCLATASGVSAIHVALLAALGDGQGPLAVQNEVYGGTHELLTTLRWPVPIVRFGLADAVDVARSLPPGAVLHTELPTNPLVRLIDLPALRAAAPHATIVVDATFASPHLVQPLSLGADLVVHSATKYLGGHHDVVAGVVSGGGERLKRAWHLRKVLGPTLDPAAAYRLWRGLRTLELRIERQSRSAALIARRLQEHPAVRAVHHPSLPDHPDHALALATFRGGLCGGVLSFELADSAAAAALIDRLERFEIAASLGGVASLVTWPAGVTHVQLDRAEREAAGIADGLLRLAIGIEDPEALWADLAAALPAPTP
jgi:cystathionine beta-lyase/cystathionine gamma-synthase